MLPYKRSRGESTSPSKLESNICTLCEKAVADGDSLECAWCEQLQHRSCAKISDDQYCVLVNHPTNLVYFCTPCTHKLPSALATSDIVDEVNATIDKALKSFELNLTNKFNGLSDQFQHVSNSSQFETIECQLKESSKQHQVTFSDLSAKVDALAKDIASNNIQLAALKNQFDGLHKGSPAMELEEGALIETTGSLKSESVSTITVGVVDEHRERDRRKLNLIFHNVLNQQNRGVQKERLMISVQSVACYINTLVLNLQFLMLFASGKSLIDPDFLKSLSPQHKKNPPSYVTATN